MGSSCRRGKDWALKSEPHKWMRRRLKKMENFILEEKITCCRRPTPSETPAEDLAQPDRKIWEPSAALSPRPHCLPAARWRHPTHRSAPRHRWHSPADPAPAPVVGWVPAPSSAASSQA